MDLNKIFKYAWEIFVKDIVALLVGGLIAGILSFVTLGILAGPLYGGIVRMIIRRIRENKSAEIGDVFSAMDQFGVLFITTLVLGILIFLGFVLCIVPGILLATIWMYVLVFIVDKRLSMGEAMSNSKGLVTRVGFGMHLVVLLILGVIAGVLSITYIGSLVVSPFLMVVICVMYFMFAGEESLLVRATSRTEVVSQQPSSPPLQPDKSPVVDRSPPVASAPVDVTPKGANQPYNVASNVRVAYAVCQRCNARSGGGAFCIECGAPLKIVCSNCKKELVSGARFCPSCGFRIEP